MPLPHHTRSSVNLPNKFRSFTRFLLHWKHHVSIGSVFQKKKKKGKNKFFDRSCNLTFSHFILFLFGTTCNSGKTYCFIHMFQANFRHNLLPYQFKTKHIKTKFKLSSGPKHSFAAKVKLTLNIFENFNALKSFLYYIDYFRSTIFGNMFVNNCVVIFITF